MNRAIVTLVVLVCVFVLLFLLIQQRETRTEKEDEKDDSTEETKQQAVGRKAGEKGEEGNEKDGGGEEFNIYPRPFRTGYIRDARQLFANQCENVLYPLKSLDVNYGLPPIPGNSMCLEFVQPE